MEQVMELVATYKMPLVIVAMAAVALAWVNRDTLLSYVKRPAKRVVPAEQIVEASDLILANAIKLEPAERDKLFKLADEVKHVAQRTIIETPE